MSDHGWKGILLRVKRWLAAPVEVRFSASRDGPAFGPRSLSLEPVAATDPPAPPRREPLRFADPLSRPTGDRQRARENEYFLLQDEIARLVNGDNEFPSPYG